MTENPLQKYVDEFDQEVAQPPLSAEAAVPVDGRRL